MGLFALFAIWGKKRGLRYAKQNLLSNETILALTIITNIESVEKYPEGGYKTWENIMGGGQKVGFMCLTNQRLIIMWENFTGTGTDQIGAIELKNVQDISIADTVNVTVTHVGPFKQQTLGQIKVSLISGYKYLFKYSLEHKKNSGDLVEAFQNLKKKERKHKNFNS